MGGLFGAGGAISLHHVPSFLLYRLVHLDTVPNVRVPVLAQGAGGLLLRRDLLGEGDELPGGVDEAVAMLSGFSLPLLTGE